MSKSQECKKFQSGNEVFVRFIPGYASLVERTGFAWSTTPESRTKAAIEKLQRRISQIENSSTKSAES